MRLYEDNINKTLIQNDGRKESGVDVSLDSLFWLFIGLCAGGVIAAGVFAFFGHQ